MTCANCEKATLWHQWGGFTAQCQECQTREIISGPQFFDSRKAKRITPEYKRVLQRIWGEQWRVGHAACKALYESQHPQEAKP
jgi:hypothetical protein